MEKTNTCQNTFFNVNIRNHIKLEKLTSKELFDIILDTSENGGISENGLKRIIKKNLNKEFCEIGRFEKLDGVIIFQAKEGNEIDGLRAYYDINGNIKTKKNDIKYNGIKYAELI